MFNIAYDCVIFTYCPKIENSSNLISSSEIHFKTMLSLIEHFINPFKSYCNKGAHMEDIIKFSSDIQIVTNFGINLTYFVSN